MCKSGDIRTHRIKKNIAITAICKGLSMLISFLYVPLLLHSMDSDNYAVWLTLTSMVSWVNLFDIGLGNGLRNKLSESLANGLIDQGRQFVSTAYFTNFVIASVLCVTFLSISPFFNWAEILNAGKISDYDIHILVNVVFCCFCLNLLLGLINSVMYAVQKPAGVSIIALFGQILSYVVVVVVVKYFAITDLLSLGCIISIIPPSVMVISTVYIFLYPEKAISPKLCLFDKNKVSNIFGLGIKFFILQIVTILLFQMNNLIITHTIGPEAVVEYNISYKYMYITVTLFTLICMPIWSASTEAYIKGDFQWIEKIKKKLNYIAFVFSGFGLLQVLLSKWIYRFWVGNECPDIPVQTTLLLFIFAMGMNLYAVYGYILNGIGKLKIQIVCTTIIAVAYIPIAFIVSKFIGLNALLALIALVPWLNYIWSRVQFTKIIQGNAKGIWLQ